MSSEGKERREEAYRAISSASEWLTEIRKSAEGENRGLWGDSYTDWESGMMTFCEGVSSILMAVSEDSDIVDVDNKRCREDVEEILSQVEEGEYGSDPYPPGDTEDFTDAVSYSTTVLQLGLESEVDSPPEKRVRGAISDNVEWFLDNCIESNSGVGWGWCGSDEVENSDLTCPPQTYFTFSSVVALSDTVSDYPELVDEDEVISVLQDAKNFLLEDCRRDAKHGVGWIQFEPLGDEMPEDYDPLKETPEFLATCYTLWGLCYMGNRVEEVDFEEDEKEILDEGVEYLLERAEGNVDYIVKKSNSVYKCGEEFEAVYEDSTTPYTLLNTLLEYSKMREDSKETEVVMSELVDNILSDCWDRDSSGGFVHFPGGSEEDSYAVIYASQVAVESLLNYGIERPPEFIDEEGQENIPIGTVVNSLESINDEVRKVQEALPGGSPTDRGSPDEIERLNKDFIESYMDAQDEIETHLSDFFSDIYDRVKVDAGKELMHELARQNPKELHVTEFPDDLLLHLYFTSDPEEYRERIDYFKSRRPLLILPYKNVFDELAEVDMEAIQNHTTRKEKIMAGLDSIREETKEIENRTKDIAEDLIQSYQQE
jgi:hypothetical protein